MLTTSLTLFLRQLLSFSLVLFSAYTSVSALASDHLDHSVNKNDAVADLTDLYAFPAPENPNLLAVVINSYPIVSSKGHFSDQLTLRLVIHKTELIQKDGGPALQHLKTVIINCKARHNDDNDHHLIMQCHGPESMHAQASFDQPPKNNQQQFNNNDFPLYAGRRADLFFFNPLWVDAAINKGHIQTPRKFNIIKGFNVLSIAMQLDPLKLFGDENLGMYALSIESLNGDPDHEGTATIDRIGRAEMTNVTLTKVSLPDLRTSFNQISVTDFDNTDMTVYRQRIIEQLERFDTIDEQRDWNDLQLQNAAKLLVDDYLTIDMNKPCAGELFLSLEMAWLKGEQHQNCGGRSFNDDVMDILFTFYINQNNGQRYSDGPDRPQLTPSQQFPYLPAPTTGFVNWLKMIIANIFF